MTDVLTITAVAVLLVAVAVPAVGSLNAERDAASIARTVAQLEDAVLRHWHDTGRLALETTEDGRPWRQFRQLSKPSNGATEGAGYLDASFNRSVNPFGGEIVVYDDLAGGVHRPLGGSFLTLDASPVHLTGPGQFVAFERVPNEVAELVDFQLDGLADAGWRRTGRVQWRPEGGGTLLVLLLDI